MIELIQDQIVTFDDHGSGMEINPEGLHMHKKMLEKKFRGIEIKIPFNPDRNIYYPDDRSEDALYIINEIKRVLSRDRQKMTLLVKKIASVITSYSEVMTEKERAKFAENSAKTIANFLGIDRVSQDGIYKKIIDKLIYDAKYIGNDGYEYTIKQDFHEKNVKIYGKKRTKNKKKS